jgi:hypothetical protein
MLIFNISQSTNVEELSGFFSFVTIKPNQHLLNKALEHNANKICFLNGDNIHSQWKLLKNSVELGDAIINVYDTKFIHFFPSKTSN